MQQALILCGGLGTRLGALTASTPKPLLCVGDRPFLDILLLELGRHGVKHHVMPFMRQTGILPRLSYRAP